MMNITSNRDGNTNTHGKSDLLIGSLRTCEGRRGLMKWFVDVRLVVDDEYAEEGLLSLGTASDTIMTYLAPLGIESAEACAFQQVGKKPLCGLEEDGDQ